MNIFLSIKEPCHQGWGNMSVSEKGKFCSSCQKHVHDFSNSSIDEIKKAYFESEDGLCGHVPVKLLQEQYVDKNIQIEYISHLKNFWIAAVLCFGASLFTIDLAKANTFYKIKTSLFNFVVASNDTIVVKGLVKDKSTKEPIPFAVVSVRSNGSVISYARTNANGEYEVKISKEFSTVDFYAIYIGFNIGVVKNVSIAINKNIVVDIELELGKELMLEGDIDINAIEPK